MSAIGYTKHGMTGTPEYIAWCNMKNRCYREQDGAYQFYGARGITVCDEWRKDFLAFYRDVGPRPGLGYSLDRRDNDGNYESENVWWVLSYQQHTNKRTTQLTNELVNEIRGRHEHGESWRSIADRLNQSYAAVTKAGNYGSWRHVP